MSFAWGNAIEAQYLLTMHCFYTDIKRAWVAPLHTQNCLCPAERSSDHILRETPTCRGNPRSPSLSHHKQNRRDSAKTFVILRRSPSLFKYKTGVAKSNLIFITVFLNSKCGNDQHLSRVKQTCSMEECFGVMISTAQRQTERNNMLACTSQMTPDKPIKQCWGRKPSLKFYKLDPIYFT